MNTTMNTNKTKLYLCRNNFLINRLNARILLKIEYNLAFFYLLTLSAIIKNVSNADTRHVFPGFSKRMHQLEEEGKIHTDVKASFKRAVKSRAKAYSIYENNKNFTDILEGDST